eukprot:764307-Hanusia_phi.AAC.1
MISRPLFQGFARWTSGVLPHCLVTRKHHWALQLRQTASFHLPGDLLSSPLLSSPLLSPLLSFSLFPSLTDIWLALTVGEGSRHRLRLHLPGDGQRVCRQVAAGSQGELLLACCDDVRPLLQVQSPRIYFNASSLLMLTGQVLRASARLLSSFSKVVLAWGAYRLSGLGCERTRGREEVYLRERAKRLAHFGPVWVRETKSPAGAEQAQAKVPQEQTRSAHVEYEDEELGVRQVR